MYELFKKALIKLNKFDQLKLNEFFKATSMEDELMSSDNSKKLFNIRQPWSFERDNEPIPGNIFF